MKNRRTIFTDGTAAQISNLMILSGIRIFDIREKEDGCAFSVDGRDLKAVKRVLDDKRKKFVFLYEIPHNLKSIRIYFAVQRKRCIFAVSKKQ